MDKSDVAAIVINTPALSSAAAGLFNKRDRHANLSSQIFSGTDPVVRQMLQSSPTVGELFELTHYQFAGEVLQRNEAQQEGLWVFGEVDFHTHLQTYSKTETLTRSFLRCPISLAARLTASSKTAPIAVSGSPVSAMAWRILML